MRLVLFKIAILYKIFYKSPLLFLLFLFDKSNLKDLFSNLLEGVSMNCFLDDTSFCIFSPWTDENCKLLTTYYNKCYDRAQFHMAHFLFSKYQLIHLSWKRFINKSSMFDLVSQQIMPPKYTTKLVNAGIDWILTWKPQPQKMSITKIYKLQIN